MPGFSFASCSIFGSSGNCFMLRSGSEVSFRTEAPTIISFLVFWNTGAGFAVTLSLPLSHLKRLASIIRGNISIAVPNVTIAASITRIDFVRFRISYPPTSSTSDGSNCEHRPARPNDLGGPTDCVWSNFRRFRGCQEPRLSVVNAITKETIHARRLVVFRVKSLSARPRVRSVDHGNK